MIKIFVEHVALEYTELIVFAKRLELGFKRKCDFSKVDTLRQVQQQLKAIEPFVRRDKKSKNNKSKLSDIKNRCNAFFSEVISTLCFGQRFNEPESQLIDELINIVFDEQKQLTKQLVYSSAGNDGVDSVPVMRSFLLQLLLEYNLEKVMEHLNNYLRKSRMVIQDEQSICLLCIQCIEDAIFKKSFSNSAVSDDFDAYIKLLNEGNDVMKVFDTQSNNVTVEYLEAVAKIRFVCFSLTESLYKRNIRDDFAFSQLELSFLTLLLKVCEDPVLNTKESGPGIFLMKQMARQHGVSFLGKICSIEETKWVMPVHLRKKDQFNEEYDDPFVVYEEYAELKEQISDAILSKSLDAISDQCKNLTNRGSIAFLLAVFQVVTLRHAYPTDDPRQLPSDIKASFLSFVRNIGSLDKQLKAIGEVFIQCSHCNKFQNMRPSFEQNEMHNRRVTEVVIHTAVVFQAKKGMFIFKPFLNLLTSPGGLKNAFLPACPGSSLSDSIKAVLGGAFNKCPKGHPYFIDVCGNLTEHLCPKCGIKVSKRTVDSISDNDNKLDTTDQSTYTGYILGNPHEQKADHQVKERNLSSTSCAIIRALVNACLIWAACVNEDATQGLVDLVKPKVVSKDLPGFFWKHLENNIIMLSKAINKSEDDACLLLHTVLRRISTERYPNYEETKVEADLKSEEHRVKWEYGFNFQYIHPIVKEITGFLNRAHQAMSETKTAEHDPLHYTIYEKIEIPKAAVIPRLWTYRPRITMDTFFQRLQSETTSDGTPLYPILQYLSEHEPMLRATEYLPEIVKLQKLLHETYNRKVDRVEANKITVAKFLASIKSKSSREEAEQNFKAVKVAWTLVKQNLSEYSRIGIQEEYISCVWDIETLPVVYLIPSLSGPGACTNALLEGLVHVHNGFVDHCQFVLKKRQKKKRNVWAEREVLVKHVQHCHLVEYQQQLLSMVLSHCRYSLKHGGGQEITYDFDSLEKSFIDRFVHGKPKIILQISEIRYREEAYSIADVKRTVNPKELSVREKSEIVNELKTTQALRSTLDIVEIVMGFMSSGKYKATLTLAEFVTKYLKMKDQFASRKAMEYCTMEHILSLWTVLSVEMARRLLRTDQEPFTGLDDTFLVPLDKEKEKKKLHEFLQNQDVDKFLHLLFEFIEAFVKHSQDYVKGSWKLIDTLIGYSEVFEEYSKHFPDSVQVGQVVGVWKEVANYQKTKVTEE